MAYNVQKRKPTSAAAAARGMDPDIAAKVARSEGLARGVWQSNIVHPTRGREPSYGPFQLLVGGNNGWPEGVGNRFVKETGLDPSNPGNWKQTVDYGLDVAAREGWGQWYGAKHAGIGNWDGIRGAKPAGVSKPVELPAEAQAFVNNNLQPGGFGPGISDPNSATPAPASAPSSPPPFGSMFPAMAGSPASPVPVEVAEYATAEDKKGNPLSKFLSSLETMPAAPLGRFPGGPSAAQANALTNVLNNPTAADLLMSKRMPRRA